MPEDDDAPAARRAELAAFLRTQRARLRPADVGLAEYGDPAKRRTPGLRREEIAELANVSVTWYTWLEQGRGVVSASEQVVDALARALRLDPDRHRYLRGLAGLTAPTAATTVGDALPRLQRLVDAAAPNPASIYDPHYDYVAWNTSYARLRHDPGQLPPERRNLLWYLFADPDCRARMPGWESAARAVLSQFRSAVGQRSDDPRFATVVAELSAVSPQFQRWWAEYPIRSFRPAAITIDHPEVGRLELELFQLRPVEHADLLLVVQVPQDDASRQRLSRLTAP